MLCKLFQYPRFVVQSTWRLVTSIKTRNVRLFTFVFSIKFIKSVVSLRFDFCDFDIDCSNVHLSTKQEKLDTKCPSFWKQISIMSVYVGSRLIFFLSVVGNFFLVLSVVSNIFRPVASLLTPFTPFTCKVFQISLFRLIFTGFWPLKNP